MKTLLLILGLSIGLTGCASKGILSVTDPGLYDLSRSCGTYVTHTPQWASLYGRTMHYGPFMGLYMLSLDSAHAAMVQDCRQYRAMKYGPTVMDPLSQEEVSQGLSVPAPATIQTKTEYRIPTLRTSK